MNNVKNVDYLNTKPYSTYLNKFPAATFFFKFVKDTTNFIFLQILEENFSPAGEFFPSPAAARRLPPRGTKRGALPPAPAGWQASLPIKKLILHKKFVVCSQQFLACKLFFHTFKATVPCIKAGTQSRLLFSYPYREARREWITGNRIWRYIFSMNSVHNAVRILPQ